MRASTKRILSIMFSTILLLAAVIIYVQMIRPAYSDVSKLRGRIQAQQTLLSRQTQAVNQIQSFIGQLQSQNIVNFQNQISLVLPNTESVPGALSQYQAIAQASGLSVQSVGVETLAIKQPTDNAGLVNGIGSERFDLKLLGPYEALKAFLRAVETNVRLTDLVSLKVTPVNLTTSNLYIIEAVVDSYYQSH